MSTPPGGNYACWTFVWSLTGRMIVMAEEAQRSGGTEERSCDCAGGFGVVAFVGLGSNVGDRVGHLHLAIRAMEAIPETSVVRISRLMETPAWGPVAQPDYLNAVAEVRTACAPRELLVALLTIEREHGRDRTSGVRWGPRTLDLDLLVYGDRVIEEPGLRVPHPRMAERRFVLEPLAELAPELVIPGTAKTVREHLAEVVKDAPAGGRCVEVRR